MCGIVGFTGKTDGVGFLLDGLSKLEYRGYDSAGITLIGDRKFKTEKTVGRIESLRKKCENISLVGNVGIGHTRWATHGGPTEQNSHPHFSNNGKFAVVHNGIIENFEEIKAELELDGFKFYSETDTEVIPNLLQKYYSGDLKNAVNSLQKRLKGSYALGILCTDHPHTLVAVKHLSPLILGIGEDCNIIASDVTAIAPKTKKIIYIEDGDTAFVTPNSVEIFADSLMVERKITTANWKIESAEKSGYKHYMMKEICEQPSVIRNILNAYISDGYISFPKLKMQQSLIKNIDRIVIIACGSAYHAGVVGKYVFEELLGVSCEVDLASEFRYRNPVLSQNTLTIAISQSGETADTIAAMKEAKRKGAHVLSVVNVEESTIAKLANSVIYTLAGPEIAVATTKGYSSQLVCIYLLAIFLGEKLGKIDENTKKELIHSLEKLPVKIDEIISSQEKIARIANDFKNEDNMFFIGRNIDYVVAMEASLKIKEISYIHSEAFASGELKHGTISLIEDGTPVIAISSIDDLREKLISNVKEVLARGAKVLLVTTEDYTQKETENVIVVPHTRSVFSASLSVIPLQIFAYYVALYNGCDIDKPRNLAKSVTVE